MEPTLDNNATVLPNKVAEDIALPPPKRPKLSPEGLALTSMPAHPNTSHHVPEAPHGQKLTRVQVDYWRWKYEEVSQYVAASMPPGLLSVLPHAPAQLPSQSPTTQGSQLSRNADMELAYEINMEMGLVPRKSSSQEGTETSESQSDSCANSLESTPSSLPSADCGVILGYPVEHSTPPCKAGLVSDLGATCENLHDLGISLQRQAREQLDLVQMSLSENEGKLL